MHRQCYSLLTLLDNEKAVKQRAEASRVESNTAEMREERYRRDGREPPFEM